VTRRSVAKTTRRLTPLDRSAPPLGVASLPPLHRDPFDRLLVAQAILLDATLVTADAVLAGYPAETLLV